MSTILCAIFQVQWGLAIRNLSGLTWICPDNKTLSDIFKSAIVTIYSYSLTFNMGLDFPDIETPLYMRNKRIFSDQIFLFIKGVKFRV